MACKALRDAQSDTREMSAKQLRGRQLLRQQVLGQLLLVVCWGAFVHAASDEGLSLLQRSAYVIKRGETPSHPHIPAQTGRAPEETPSHIRMLPDITRGALARTDSDEGLSRIQRSASDVHREIDDAGLAMILRNAAPDVHTESDEGLSLILRSAPDVKAGDASLGALAQTENAEGLSLIQRSASYVKAGDAKAGAVSHTSAVPTTGEGYERVEDDLLDFVQEPTEGLSMLQTGASLQSGSCSSSGGGATCGGHIGFGEGDLMALIDEEEGLSLLQVDVGGRVL